MRNNPKELAQELVNFINSSASMYNAVANMAKILEEKGFTRLELGKKFEIEEKNKYYLTIGSSSIVAFRVNGSNIEKDGFRIIGSHSDSPCFRIKSKPEIKRGNMLTLNIEPYGGMIVSTWLDRPLSIAGRVFMKNPEDIFRPKEYLVDFDEPMLMIPNLAIHMNRSVNDGYSYNKQKDLAPIVLEDFDSCGFDTVSSNEEIDSSVLRDRKKFDEDYIKNQLKMYLEKEYGFKNISKDSILDYDLYLYEFEKGGLVGKNQSYISAGKLDNLASAHASITALVDSEEVYSDFDGVDLVCVLNNEEIGSVTKEGADSSSIANILERISIALGKNKEEYLMAIENSFMLSADLAHASHPNYPEHADPTNNPVFGGGVVIKIHAGKAYATDGQSSSVFRDICDRNKIKNQTFYNRSDKRSGSTIGSIMSSYLPMPIVDVGIPILAMHSIRELGNTRDYMEYYRSMYHFFTI